MNWELLLLIFGKTLQASFLKTLGEIDWSQPTDPVISKELKAAKNLDEIHAAVKKLRRKVSK